MTLPANRDDWTFEDYQAAISAHDEVAEALRESARLGARVAHVWSEYPSARTMGDYERVVAANPGLSEELQAEREALHRLAAAYDVAIGLGVLSETDRDVMVLSDGSISLRVIE